MLARCNVGIPQLVAARRPRLLQQTCVRLMSWRRCRLYLRNPVQSGGPSCEHGCVCVCGGGATVWTLADTLPSINRRQSHTHERHGIASPLQEGATIGKGDSVWPPVATQSPNVSRVHGTADDMPARLGWRAIPRARHHDVLAETRTRGVRQRARRCKGAIPVVRIA